MTDNAIKRGLAGGCVAGFGLSGLFFVVGAVLYFAGRAVGLNRDIALIIGFAGGPTLSMVAVLGAFVLRTQGRSISSSNRSDDDAPAPGHDA